jgi:hypothetical protein
MSQKTIIIAMLAILFGLFAGGGIVYQFTRQNSVQTNKTVSSTKSEVTKSESDALAVSNTSLSSTSVSINSSKVADKPKPEGTRFVGWIGSVDTEVYLNFDKDRVTGKYYNNIDKKWFELSGSYNATPDKTTGIIDLSEYDGGLVTGKMSFSAIENSNIFNTNDASNLPFQNYGVSAGNYYNKTFVKLVGTYTDVNNNPNDIYLYVNEDNFKSVQAISRNLSYIKTEPSNSFETATAFFQDGDKYFFTKEVWKLPADTKSGDKLKITGKLRNYNWTKSITLKQEPYEGQSTNQGFFQITKVEKL